MENGFVVVQYFVVKMQQDDTIEMLALYMCTVDGGGGGGGGGGGRWLGVVGIWKAVHLRTCDIVLGVFGNC